MRGIIRKGKRINKSKFIRPEITDNVYDIVEGYLLDKINIIFLTDDLDLSINKKLIKKICNKYYYNMSNYKLSLYFNSYTKLDIYPLSNMKYVDFDIAMATAILYEFESEYSYDPCDAINNDVQKQMDKLFDTGNFEDMVDLARHEYCNRLGIKYKTLENSRHIISINY